MKERYAVSRMRKQANRMTFGEVHKQLSLVATVGTRGEESVSYSVVVCKYPEEYRGQPVYP